MCSNTNLTVNRASAAERQSEQRVNVFSSSPPLVSEWRLKATGAPRHKHTQAPIHPLAEWSAMNSGRRVVAAEEEEGREEEGGRTVTQEFHWGARDPWARQLHPPSAPLLQGRGPSTLLKRFSCRILTWNIKPRVCRPNEKKTKDSSATQVLSERRNPSPRRSQNRAQNRAQRHLWRPGRASYVEKPATSRSLSSQRNSPRGPPPHDLTCFHCKLWAWRSVSQQQASSAASSLKVQ